MTELLSRRNFLSGMGALAIWSGLGGSVPELLSPALAAAEQSVPLRLSNLHTGEAYDVELFINGAWNSNALIVCDYMMRDWRQSEAPTCDRRLYAALYVLQRYFSPNERVRIHSGYRSQKTNLLLREKGYNAAPNSQHLKAKAVDFSMQGADLRGVARATEALKLGGTGLYLSDGFVHMDSRGVQTAGAGAGSGVKWGDSF